LTCPDCGQISKNKAGLSQHRRRQHGWKRPPHRPHPIEDELPEPPPGADEIRPEPEEKRPRLLFSRRPRPRVEVVGPASDRPRVKRVSTSPLTTTLVSFAAGGLSRVGQGPLAFIMGFTAPVAGEIVDDAIAGTLPDKLVQPLVRGSEKYEKVSALVAVWGSVAWASNNPENADAAFGIFRWGMSVVLPLAGKEMVKRAKDEKKMVEQMEELMPELRELFGDDPIRGLWENTWRMPVTVPPEHADETVSA
jgi:hypothetical protein